MSLQDDIARYEADYHARMPARAATGDVAKAVAAGLERDYYLVKLADLPDVTQRHGFLHVDGAIGVCATNASQSQRETALRELSLAVALQSRESEAAALDARRDELTRAYSPAFKEQSYDDLLHVQQVVIDDHLAIQDRAAAAEAEVARLTKEAGR